jgi:ABC-type Fe3+/spermidine/putrescine transport system ATPase subunit
MTDTTDFDEIQSALDERLEWIKAVTRLGLEQGIIALRDEIEKLDEETTRSVLFVLLTHYQAEAERLNDRLAQHSP